MTFMLGYVSVACLVGEKSLTYLRALGYVSVDEKSLS